MQSQSVFKAPWGTFVIAVSALVSVLLVGLPIIFTILSPGSEPLMFVALYSPILILIVAMFFMIRGYVLSGDALFVRRLFWNSKIDLSGLTTVEFNPEAMSKSIRTFGNGGLFAICGFFRNKTLGSYRAFATDPKKSVVLKFPGKVIVVTPDRPEEFVGKIKSFKNLG